MGIGGALAEARTEAGLTLTQVSERTRIREKIIRDIEHDDYSACGGDYYARGHIRAIARVVGTDPVPLIEEYDAARMPPEPAEPETDRADSHGWRIPSLHRIADTSPGDNGLAGNTRWEGTFYGTSRSGNGVASNSVARNRYGSAGMPPDGEHGARADAVTGADLSNPGTLPGGITAAEAFRPWMPLEPRRRRKGTGALALLVLAAIGVLVYLLVAGGSKPSPRPHATTHHSAGTTAAKHPSGKGTAKAKAKAAVPSQTPAPLAAANATAFGPAGFAHGDDPQQASLVLDRTDSVGWHTDWYASPNFGGLQPGTGVLLDMGQAVTVTSARLQLGPTSGGAVELRAGDRPSLRRLHVVAQAANTGGSLTMPVSSPVSARYLLIWFTALPPDGTGSYQATIYKVSLLGTS